jgi:hypothetical protein
MDIVERIIVYRDRSGRSREGREMLADAANEIDKLRGSLRRIVHSISASCMRHVVEGVGKIAREALET